MPRPGGGCTASQGVCVQDASTEARNAKCMRCGICGRLSPPVLVLQAYMLCEKIKLHAAAQSLPNEPDAM